MNCLPWLRQNPTEIRLEVKVKPGAKQNKINLVDEAGLQISLQASPQEGKANKMLIQYLSKLLAVPQKRILILRGNTSRNKLLSIEVEGREQERVRAILLGNVED
ncbi:DUF167 domain-containing protein [Legionella jordanis]|uniref:UPF0235 protein Ljor_2508 n=1 Tax=Legionella jordanis TaxID=456 RepID=A0A0W0VDN4_9GAMM|nr:DUF167 domain-containing protein [Legionella jordanis]KTD18202.1 hypothetical protein Ljor_2508 [Legionella jordanis]RMX01162.1 DUF167 domain-containing protein [Legionella jordanis]RMX21392.1 DUF167 domain-containing protein [Legionella jordanis]VEH13705.1 Uncharacterised ACR, YggU family COG1872 [Legionella jordanis]HAT8714584.1 hypothetical protein [Legionella jordanis]